MQAVIQTLSEIVNEDINKLWTSDAQYEPAFVRLMLGIWFNIIEHNKLFSNPEIIHWDASNIISKLSMDYEIISAEQSRQSLKKN